MSDTAKKTKWPIWLRIVFAVPVFAGGAYQASRGLSELHAAMSPPALPECNSAEAVDAVKNLWTKGNKTPAITGITETREITADDDQRACAGLFAQSDGHGHDGNFSFGRMEDGKRYHINVAINPLTALDIGSLSFRLDTLDANHWGRWRTVEQTGYRQVSFQAREEGYNTIPAHLTSAPKTISLSLRVEDMPQVKGKLSGAGFYVGHRNDDGFVAYTLNSDGWFTAVDRSDEGFHYISRIHFSGITPGMNSFMLSQEDHKLGLIINGRHIASMTNLELTPKVGIFLATTGDGRVDAADFAIDKPPTSAGMKNADTIEMVAAED